MLKKIFLILACTIIFFSCGKKEDVEKLLSTARNKIAQDLNLIDNDPTAEQYVDASFIFEATQSDRD